MSAQIGVSGSLATVPNPVHVPAYGMTVEHRGSQYETKSGTTRRHVAATKRTWTPMWEALSSADYTTLTTELNRTAQLVWAPDATMGGGSYNVLVVRWRRIDDGRRGTCVEAELIEV